MTREEIFTRISNVLAETFEIDPARIKLETTLFQELGLDSIDAIDLVVKLQELTGTRVSDQTLRAVRTVDDVVSIVEAHITQAPAAVPEVPDDGPK